MKAEIAHRMHSSQSPHAASAYTFSSPDTLALIGFASFSFGVVGVSVSTAEADSTDPSACAPFVQGSPIPTIEYGQRRGTNPLRQRRRSALYPEVPWGPSLTAAPLVVISLPFKTYHNAAIARYPTTTCNASRCRSGSIALRLTWRMRR